MRKNQSQHFLIFIVLIAIATVFINLPAIHVHFTLPKLPSQKKPVTVDRIIGGEKWNGQIGSVKIQKDLSFRKGLDLEGGTSVTLQAQMKDIPASQRDDALESAKTVIENRVNLFGVSEPVVQTAKVNGDYRILVDLPGVTDMNQALSLIGQTAKLTFWEEGASGSAKISSESAALYPYGVLQLFGDKAKQTNLTGADLKSANVSFDTNNGNPQVQLQFTGDGTKKFADITQRNVGKIVAIALDQIVVEAPRVNEAINTGNAVISGQGFTLDTAKQLQVQLNAGALPISLTVLSRQAVGATLGQQSLEKSLFAGILGFVIIVIFMTVLYGRLGVIASMALILYTLITLSLFRLVPVTLTLAGIAGFILSIGIAVDANILIFERMKEEVRAGRSRELALDLGFTRAWSSIRDSNIASLITCSVLYYFGTGIVKGFALTLALGVIVSLFSAITVTRTLLYVFYNKPMKAAKEGKELKRGLIEGLISSLWN